MSNTPLPIKLEIHYYLKDNSHSMDAFVYNECEHELLFLIKELQSLFSIKDFSLDVEAIAEGGLRSRLVVFIKDKQTILLALGLIGGVMTTKLTEDRELKVLEKEKLRLEIEILKKQLNQNTAQDTLHVEMTKAISSDIKIAKRKSNYYTNLLKDKRIAKISTSLLDEDNQIISEERVVERNMFKDFILTTDELDSIIVEDAIVEIVSPVLKDKRFKWRGIYNGTNFSFEMMDIEFIQQIITEKVVFRRGTFIECVLEIKQKLNEMGEVIIKGYNVLIVLRSFDHLSSFETPQGIDYKKSKELEEGSDNYLLV